MTETAYGNAQDLLVELTADIVAAYVSNHVVPVTELPGLISDVHTALSGTSAPASVAVNVEKQKPAVSVRKSVQDDHIVCLECGGSFKSLKRHLTTMQRPINNKRTRIGGTSTECQTRVTCTLH
jgi:predicted transcriptional regulator